MRGSGSDPHGRGSPGPPCGLRSLARNVSIGHLSSMKGARIVAKSATQLLSDSERIRASAGRLAKVNKNASDLLKKEAEKLEMRAVRRMRQRVKRGPGTYKRLVI